MSDKKEVPDYMKTRCFVRWGKEVIEVLVDPMQPSVTMKEKLEEITKIPVDDQRIFYNGIKTPFAHEKNLRYYGAHAGGFFDLARDEDLDEDMNIIKKPHRRVSMEDEMKKQAEAAARQEANLRAHDEKRRAQEEKMRKLEAYRAKAAAKKAAEEIEVHVKTPDGKTITVKIKPADTIQSLKESVVPEAGIEVPHQVMRHKGKELPNTKTAKDLGLENGSVIDLEPKKINVQVKTFDGKIIPVQMKLTDTVASIKGDVATQSGLEVPQQVMKFKGKEIPNDDTADAVGLKEGSVIDLAPRPINVQVKTADGKIIPVQISPFDKIHSIKESVAPEAGLEVEQQILSFGGKELPDAEMAGDMGLKDGSVIDLEPRAIEIKVRTPDGRIIPVNMKPSETVGAMKEKAAPASGIKADRQILKMDGQELSNNQTAKGLGLADGAIIDLEPKPITVQVKTSDGKLIPVQMKPSDSVASLKEKAAPDSGVKPDKQILKLKGKELTNNQTADGLGLEDGTVIDLEPATIEVKIRTPHGKLIPIQMKPSDNVQFLKEKAAPASGIKPDKQILKLLGKELFNNQTADGLGLTDGAIIDLEPAEIEVKVRTPDGKVIPIKMKPSDNIQFLKEKAAPGSGIRPAKQILRLQGKELPNNQTADGLGLQDGTVMDLEPAAIGVKVRTPDGKLIPIQMKPSDSIQSLKEKAAPGSGVKPDKQILRVDGEELPSNDTVEGLGLEDGTIIDLEPKPINLQVKTPDGKLIPVQMKASDSIQSLKEKAAAGSGVQPDKQLLRVDGKELPNNGTAEGLGLEDGTIIDLESKPITVHVKTPDGKTISVEMAPSDSIGSVKDRVAAEAGIPVPEQVMKFNGNEVPDTETAASLDLQDGSTLDLDSSSIKVDVKTPDGKTLTVTLKPSDSIKDIKEAVAEAVEIEVPKQILKFNGNELSNDDTAGGAGLKNGSILDLEAKPEPKPKKEKKEKKKKKERRDSKEYAIHESKDYRQGFQGTPLDLSRFKIHFMIGDQVPMQMICPVAMTIGDLKVEILKLKNEATFVKRYFHDLEDASVLKIYPAGSYGEGEPYPDDIPVPRDSSEYKMFSVMR